MEKNKLGFGAYMCIVAAILAVVACVIYKSVMYTYQPVFIMLIAAAVLGVLALVIGKAIPAVANYIPICMSVLLFSAIVWGSMLMVNQIGYVIAGLDGVGTILTYFIFAGFTLAAGVVTIVASFLKVGEAA